MKKGLLLFATLMMLVGCNNQTDNTDVQRERDSLQAIIIDKDDELNEFMGVFTEIQESLRQMSEAEGRVVVTDNDPERVNKVEQIREDMQFLNEASLQQRERISKLQEKLKSSSLNVKKMKEAIDNLQAQLDMQTARVQELQIQLTEHYDVIRLQMTTIDKQDEAINQLSKANAQQKRVIGEQNKQLNEGWFVFGTKSELKAQKIIDNGEVLRTGKFNQAYFTQIDIRNTKEIKLYSKNAKLLTTHPDGSYILKADKKGEYVLTVTNVQQFWSVSRYLVIQVK